MEEHNEVLSRKDWAWVWATWGVFTLSFGVALVCMFLRARGDFSSEAARQVAFQGPIIGGMVISGIALVFSFSDAMRWRSSLAVERLVPPGFLARMNAVDVWMNGWLDRLFRWRKE